MSRNNGTPVLAVGIESAELTLVRRMIEQDELPILKSLLAEGKWIRVESPANIGTSAVWPSFMTGEDVAVHGVYSEWCWEPATMSLSRLNGRHLKPFWKALAEAGNSVGIMAIPFMPFVGPSHGFEVSESDPYLLPDGAGQSGPTGIANWVTKQMVRDALSHGRISVSGPDDLNNLQRLALDSLEGIRLRGKLAERLLTGTRPDFSIIVFTETHESGHCLWQTIEPEHPLFHEDFFKKLRDIRPTLKNIYQEVDRQIGKLVNAVGADATVLVFALHGLSPARGVPTFLGPLMCEQGFSRLADLKSQSWTGRATALMSAVKRHTPNGLKRLYYKALPRDAVMRLATPTMLPQYDWSQTRAFPLVTEQHGSIRINLIGREAKGIVTVEEYEEVCREVEQWLRTLRTRDGKPLAKNVIRTAESGEQALARRIPDVLVHWEDVAFTSPLRIKGSRGEFYPEGRRYLSQHTSEGFCILKGNHDLEVEDVLPAKDMGRFMTRMVRGGARRK